MQINQNNPKKAEVVKFAAATIQFIPVLPGHSDYTSLPEISGVSFFIC